MQLPHMPAARKFPQFLNNCSSMQEEFVADNSMRNEDDQPSLRVNLGNMRIMGIRGTDKSLPVIPDGLLR